MMEVSNEILDFLTGIHGSRNNPGARKEEIFQRAFSLAYKDMATHTVKYQAEAAQYFNGDSDRATKNREQYKKALCDYVKEPFCKLSKMGDVDQKAFQKWHSKTCGDIVENSGSCLVSVQIGGKTESKPIGELICPVDAETTTAFSYGQAQKLVNMMLKYLYIFYKCEGWTDLDQIVEFFHVPIDRFVLKAALKKETFRGTPWSRIKTHDDYKACQEIIHQFYPKNNYKTAFMWELAEWPLFQNKDNKSD